MSYERHIKKAKEFLDKMVDHNIGLSKSIEYYKKGLAELNQAQKIIEEAKVEIKTIQKSEIDG